MAVQTYTPTHSIPRRWPPQGKWTYEDYARLPDNGMRYEVIRGNLYMSPAPRTKHQEVSFALAVEMHHYSKERALGRVYVAPIDVVLPNLAAPVQPDILFITQDNINIVAETKIEGVPNLIVEILSPSNPNHDRQVKFRLYAQVGVQEYWIVDPDSCQVDVFALRGNAYVPLGPFGPDGQAHSELLAGFTVMINEICR